MDDSKQPRDRRKKNEKPKYKKGNMAKGNNSADNVKKVNLNNSSDGGGAKKDNFKILNRLHN